MKGKLLSPLVLSFCFICFITVAGSLNGKWTGSLQAPDGNTYPLNFSFKVDGDSLSGSGDSPSGTVDLHNGKVSGNTFSFNMNINGVAVGYSGKVYEDSCGLDIDYQGLLMHSTLTRAVSK